MTQCQARHRVRMKLHDQCHMGSMRVIGSTVTECKTSPHEHMYAIPVASRSRSKRPATPVAIPSVQGALLTPKRTRILRKRRLEILKRQVLQLLRSSPVIDPMTDEPTSMTEATHGAMKVTINQLPPVLGLSLGPRPFPVSLSSSMRAAAFAALPDSPPREGKQKQRFRVPM
ncbi:hypothetical protein BB8028_0003g09220 [Beauveria bassiana]|uniref:Uncharacterized protein n=1 Tax=Beauveria bassiana TaxID=176275 RepID=A0A2S7Y844_BEABA|nr:hypothetical protein BB8028_0003g09220 [Beauveria bassiana]